MTNTAAALTDVLSLAELCELSIILVIISFSCKHMHTQGTSAAVLETSSQSPILLEALKVKHR